MESITLFGRIGETNQADIPVPVKLSIDVTNTMEHYLNDIKKLFNYGSGIRIILLQNGNMIDCVKPISQSIVYNIPIIIIKCESNIPSIPNSLNSPNSPNSPAIPAIPAIPDIPPPLVRSVNIQNNLAPGYDIAVIINNLLQAMANPGQDIQGGAQIQINNNPEPEFGFELEIVAQPQVQAQAQALAQVQAQAPAHIFTPEDESNLQELMSLGFERNIVIQAYISCNRVLSDAATLIFEL